MSQLQFVDGGGKSKANEYKVKGIWDSTVYIQEQKTKDHLSGFYYLIL